jgi:digeranylgeranylglycerophospholipid reductase
VERYDVVVVGAGPGGSSAARFAARGGARTLLVDQRPELGQPVQCGEFLPTPAELGDLFACPDVIQEAFWIPPETVLNRTHEMVVVAPSGHRFRFPLDGLSVSRRAFDQRLALAAEGEGAELRYPCGVTGVHGNVVTLARGDEVEARVVIGADGPLSTVARSCGFKPERVMFKMTTATLDAPPPEAIELYFGSVAPGGYAWVIPKSDASNVGLGVTSLPRGTSLGSLLDRFLSEHGHGPAHDRTQWWVPLGPPPASAVVGSSLFVGDAANLVMATNGGGIPTAMISGCDAGVAAAAHVRTGAPLTEYDRLWRAHMAGPLARAWAIKRRGDRVVRRDWLLTLGMHYIGSHGLDEMMRLRWPGRWLRGRAS